MTFTNQAVLCLFLTNVWVSFTNLLEHFPWILAANLIMLTDVGEYFRILSWFRKTTNKACIYFPTFAHIQILFL